ncbi:hypothetical protein [Streptomyces shaanxiensis]
MRLRRAGATSHDGAADNPRQFTAIRGSSGTSSGACRGEGRALREAARALPGDAMLTDVDLVGPLAPDGLLAAHFDPESARWADGSAAGRAAVSALRSAGFRYSARRHRLTLEGAREPSLPFRHLGAAPAAGPNCTGRPAVGSSYGNP